MVRFYFYLIKLFSSYRRCSKIKKDYKNIIIIYRISDSGYLKEKPFYINNENCLRNAVKTFSLEECKWHVIADNVSEDTYKMICKYLPEDKIERVSVGHGAGTFRLAYELALQYDDDDCIYFLENDYLHKDGALSVLREGISLNESDYVTLYDHPDKYGYNTMNPFAYGGEKTKVFLSNSCHWKITNSTTMTFAALVKTLRKDKKIFWKWTRTPYPFDTYIFIELWLKRRRKLLSPLPGYSTHGEVKYLSPLINWYEIK